MSKKLKISSLILIAIFFFLFSFSIWQMNQKGETIQVSSTNIASNQKIGWGIKRNENHEQPDVGSNNKKILEENGGICLGNKEKKVIYLTFDEGYEAGYTSQLLNILKENEVKATFFITAHFVNTQPNLVQQMIDEGHIVGNHTTNSLMSGNQKISKC